MVATLNQPIVTDFHPIRNRPVAVLLFLVFFAVAAVARDLTAAPVVVLAVGSAVGCGWLFRPHRDPAHPDAASPD